MFFLIEENKLKNIQLLMPFFKVAKGDPAHTEAFLNYWGPKIDKNKNITFSLEV